jgi:hypothetical protein
MINILQYPDTSNPHYIDPLYIGDNNSGFQKRIKDLKDGNYIALANTFSSSVDTIMENVSRFKYYLKNNSRSGNIAIYDIWYKPMIRGTVNSSGVITSATMITPGNEQFRQRTGANSYSGSARIKANGRFWKEGNNSTVSIATSNANITISTNSSGYVTGASGSGGSGYGGAGYVMFEIEQDAADTYPATPTALEAQDIWDTADQWTEGGDATPTKYWPSVVTPQSAEISYKMPSTITRSQSGKKYIQSAGYVKWGLEVTYPPMTANQFKEYHGIVQAARGQAIPMLFKLVQNGNSILFKNLNSGNSANALILKDPIDVSVNALVILLEGLTTGDTLNEGDTIFGANGDANGQINTIISTANANVYGEAKVRLAYPVKTDQPAGSFWNTSPDEVVVTLNDSEFEYSVSTNGLYNVSVRFELDEWK